MRKSRNRNEELQNVIPVEEIKEPVKECEVSAAPIVDFILDKLDADYKRDFGEQYLNPNRDLLPLVMATPDGDMMHPTMSNLLDHANGKDTATIFSLSDSARNAMTVPTPFVTFGQKVDHTFDLIDYVKKNKSDVSFQYNFAKFVRDATKQNASANLRAQLRHALVGFVGDIMDTYRQTVRAINSEATDVLSKFIIEGTVNTLYFKISNVFHVENPCSFSLEETDRIAFGSLVNAVLVPELLGIVFETVDREIARDICRHAIGDPQLISDIVSSDLLTEEEKKEKISKYTEGKNDMSARDLHAIFTTASFGHYKQLQGELEVIINLYRIQLSRVYDPIANDPVLEQMIANGAGLLDDAELRSPAFAAKLRSYGYDDEF